MKQQQFNVENHVLVPKHAKLNQKDIDALLAQYNISLKQLAKIRTSDPALQSLDVHEGEVIKITRISPTVGRSVFYRVVVNG